MVFFRFVGLTLPVCAVTALACGSEDLVLPPSTAASRIDVVEGNGQSGSAGMPLPRPLVVRLLDEAGSGVPGQEVNWIVSTGGGSANPVTDTTNAEGLASAEWTLGPVEGPNTLDVVVSGIGPVTFTAMAGDEAGAEPVPSASHSTVSADPTLIHAVTGSSTIRVTVRDDNGAPVAGAIVSLTASGSGNMVVQPTGPTGPDGVATGTLRSAVPGTKDVTATVNGSVQIDQGAQISVVEGPAAAEPHHFVFRVPPQDVKEDEEFSVEVAIVDVAGNVVPVSGIEIYLGLFREGRSTPSNLLVLGERFRDTDDGIAVFSLRVIEEGRYRLRALSDELPALGPHGPEPFLFSDVFEVD